MINFHFIRHSMSTYQNMRNTIQGENPEGKVDFNRQQPDVPPKGIELAEKEAGRFFEGFNPQKDILFFASSNEARAIDTADVYRRVAKGKGFSVIRTRNPRNRYAQETGQGEIRTIGALSLNAPNTILLSVFNPDPEKAFSPNWGGVREETKSAWKAAREIIEGDDRGSWAANFDAHSERVTEILRAVSPGEKSAKDQFRIDFFQILRLIRFAARTTNGHPRRIRVIGFGHENYLVIALKKFFGEHGINNCESIEFAVEGNGAVKMQFRGKEAVVA
jgi:hypothetical protein